MSCWLDSKVLLHPGHREMPLLNENTTEDDTKARNVRSFISLLFFFFPIFKINVELHI